LVTRTDALEMSPRTVRGSALEGGAGAGTVSRRHALRAVTRRGELVALDQ
jgi:hypothetical protein